MHQEAYSWYHLELCYSMCGSWASNTVTTRNSVLHNLRFHLRAPVANCMTARTSGVSCIVKSEKHLGAIYDIMTPGKVMLLMMENKAAGCVTL